MIKSQLQKLTPEQHKGLALVIGGLIALLFSNTPILSHLYHEFLEFHIGVSFGDYFITHDIKEWINDGLMALFFTWISLEIKGELIDGHLSSFDKAIFPVIAAVGGVLVPAIIYLAFNHGDPVLSQAWAIPIATDIAFVIAILSFFGDKVSPSLKVFLITLAVADDFFAILIIAIFYTSDINFTMLGYAGILIVFLFFLNRMRVKHISSYAIFGGFLWVLIAESGIHPTIAGVIMGFIIPYKHIGNYNPAKRIYEDLTFTVSFMILPLFAFANSGVSIFGISDYQSISLVLGISIGLIVGKPLGIFTFSYLANLIGIARKSNRYSWSQLFAVSCMAGIGFTISIFIVNLNFVSIDINNLARLAVIVSSVIAAIIGSVILYLVSKNKKKHHSEEHPLESQEEH